jgi:restriction endonuclease
MYNTARAAMSQYDASGIAANGESMKKFIYEQREKTKQDLANLQQIALASKQGEFEAAMKAEFEKLGGWSLIKDEELRNMLMENANYQMAMKHVDPAYFANEYHKFFKDVKLDPTYRQGIIPY